MNFKKIADTSFKFTICNLVMTLEFKEECVPQLTTKFGWSVKIKSIQELEWGSRCVGSDISWWKLCKDVSASKCVSSIFVLSLFHQDKDLALKSPRIMVNKELVEAVLLRSSSMSDRKFSIWHWWYCLGLVTCRQHQYILYSFAVRLHK